MFVSCPVVSAYKTGQMSASCQPYWPAISCHLASSMLKSGSSLSLVRSNCIWRVGVPYHDLQTRPITSESKRHQSYMPTTTASRFVMRSMLTFQYFWGSDYTLIARFMGPTWGPSRADRTQVGPMLAPWSLLSANVRIDTQRHCTNRLHIYHSWSYHSWSSETEHL